jgi:hypothetical protein
MASRTASAIRRDGAWRKTSRRAWTTTCLESNRKGHIGSPDEVGLRTCRDSLKDEVRGAQGRRLIALYLKEGHARESSNFSF